MPPALAALLFGPGAVHAMDGAAHRERKAIFLSFLNLDTARDVASRAGAMLQEAASYWRLTSDVRLFDELVRAYGGAVISWADAVPADRSTDALARDLAQIVNGFGGHGYGKAWAARLRANRWARALVREVRSGGRSARPGSVVEVFATGPGRSLSATTAGVELLNVLRPTVAVAWLGSFAALALDEHPEWRARVRDDDASREAFAQEVRRFYPFVPALEGRLRHELVWRGHHLPRGARVVLDVPGVDREPATWTDPDSFDPGRFLRSTPSPFEFVPQGGGYRDDGHRCPGEFHAVELLKSTVHVLAGLDYEVVSGHSYDRHRVPTLPEGGLRLRVR
jgi:fatty-acid peroxygenase